MAHIIQNNASSTTAKKTVLVAGFATLVLYLVPFLHPLAYPFMLLSTLIHEMAHGVAAVLVGGRFENFMMWADGSGAARISGNLGAFARAFVAAAGLIGPAVISTVLFLSLKSQRRSQVALALSGIILSLSIVLVVRNWFGAAFVAVVVLACYYFSLGGGQKYSKTATAFLAVQLALSVFSRSDYLFTDMAVTTAGVMPSDVAQMADALWLPYWFWGFLCGLFSVAVLAFGLRQVFK